MPTFAIISVLALSCAGQVADASKPSPSSPVRVASVQMRSSLDLNANLAKILSELEKCSKKGVKIAVFPECALTGYSEQSARAVTPQALSKAVEVIAEACKRLRINAIVGSAVPEGKRLFNSALVFDASGRVIERYDKVQLAESWPAPGDHLSVFSLEGVDCSIIICHDERYPELVRLPVLAGARVVFYLSHESGLMQDKKLNPYRAQIQARAVENTVFVVQANAPANPDGTGSHGQSRIIAPDGNLMLDEASFFGEDVLIADLDPKQATAANARRSLDRGPLRDWWRQGVRQVRVIR